MEHPPVLLRGTARQGLHAYITNIVGCIPPRWDRRGRNWLLFCNELKFKQGAGHLYAIEEISAIRVSNSTQQSSDDSDLV
jgi:hypothetical protein